MPLRLSYLPFALRLSQRRTFQSSAVRREGSHYETLQVPVDATPADVKKSFYALSLLHHPDRNPDDPEASSRFVKISEAWAILGTPAKRRAYDRDVLPSHTRGAPNPSSSAPQRSGSYSSTSPAGGRPASGLSRRRTQFRGPPPSFYKSGGWGAHSAKRAAAQENGAPGAEKPEFGEQGSANATTGGMGHGQMGWGHGNDVPHFDKEGHFRTQEEYDKRRRMRQKKMEDGDGFDSTGHLKGPWGELFLIGGIIVVGMMLPSFFSR